MQVRRGRELLCENVRFRKGKLKILPAMCWVSSCCFLFVCLETANLKSHLPCAGLPVFFVCLEMANLKSYLPCAGLPGRVCLFIWLCYCLFFVVVFWGGAVWGVIYVRGGGGGGGCVCYQGQRKGCGLSWVDGGGCGLCVVVGGGGGWRGGDGVCV